MEIMFDFEDEAPICLELCYLDRSNFPPAVIVENPVWESISEGIRKVYKFGGFVRLSVNEPKSSLVRELSMDSLPGRFKLAVLTSSPNPKEEYLEWGGVGDSPFRGVVRFGDDDFDSRTVCADISIAEAIFKELYETGGLDVGLSQMRSPWNPKP
ncbi:hypothetical protein I5K76_30290 [Pseudomonas aeruginosa]|nr:hypothetical protein [Pseudomonas aeruginosa]